MRFLECFITNIVLVSTSEVHYFEKLYLHWLYKCSLATAAADDHEAKSRPISEMLIARAQSIYVPDKAVSINEEIVRWCGRLQFRQYIPGKCHKYGIKLFLVCDELGYAFNWHLYNGRMEALAGFGLQRASY